MNSQTKENIVIVIPAYEPDDRLITYIKELKETCFDNIVAVDDGSGPDYQRIFDKIQEKVIVLHHDVNKGKGAALKTAYKWILENLQNISGVITADSDGQHSVADCVKIAEMLKKDDNVLYLGSRDFNLPNIPPKSRSGNKITSLIFKLLYGQYLPDTQTGLRGFRSEELPFMINVEGERYEYEMNVLIACAIAKIPMISIPIETIYENNNEGTHFNPVKDSWKIYKVLFGNFFKFMGSSLISTLVDQSLFNFLNLVVFSNGIANHGEYILASTIIARVISSVINFSLNRNLVFGKNNDGKRAFVKYVILCICVMLLSAGGTWALSRIGINTSISKIIVDTMLYFVSYHFQQVWVFSPNTSLTS